MHVSFQRCRELLRGQRGRFGATTASGQGRWFLWDMDLEPLGSGTLYESIDDLCFVNGKISFTGIMSSITTTAYVITGTPQP